MRLTTPTVLQIRLLKDDDNFSKIMRVSYSGELRPGSNWLFIILGFFANILCDHVCNQEKSMCLLEIGKNPLKMWNCTFL